MGLLSLRTLRSCISDYSSSPGEIELLIAVILDPVSLPPPSTSAPFQPGKEPPTEAVGAEEMLESDRVMGVTAALPPPSTSAPFQPGKEPPTEEVGAEEMLESDRVMGVTADYPDYDWTDVQEYGSPFKPTLLPGMESLRFRPSTAGEGSLSDQSLGGRAEIPEENGWSWDVHRPAREAPFSMLKKRLLRRFRSQSSGTVSSWQMWIAARQRSVKHFRTETRNVLSYLEMWKKSLHHIEGHFGTGIGSYFSFLRFLVLLNLSTFLIIALFVMIPAITFDRLREEGSGITTASPPHSGNCTEYDPTRKGLVNFYEYALDILTGT
ncbi:transmembrane channel-like protein 7, partial [Mustelus asterias]